jgi:hypothetical protein
LAKAKVIDGMANSIIRLAILQLRHSAPTNPQDRFSK